MNKLLQVIAFATFFIGCANDNEIHIVNNAAETIFFNFRAEIVTLPSGGETTITSVPNGNYDYNTTFRLPAGTSELATADDAASGFLSFSYSQTKYFLLYSSVTDSTTYNAFVNKTSTTSVKGVTEP